MAEDTGVKFNCAHCGEVADKPGGHVNRSRAQGLKLYCIAGVTAEPVILSAAE